MLMKWLLALPLSVMSGAALAETTGAVNPGSVPAQPSANDDVPPGGCMPIGMTTAGEIVFPIQCKEFIERHRGAAVEDKPAVEQKPAAVQAKPAAAEEKPAAVEARPAAVEEKPAAVEQKNRSRAESPLGEVAESSKEGLAFVSLRRERRFGLDQKETSAGAPSNVTFRVPSANFTTMARGTGGSTREPGARLRRSVLRLSFHVIWMPIHS